MKKLKSYLVPVAIFVLAWIVLAFTALFFSLGVWVVVTFFRMGLV